MAKVIERIGEYIDQDLEGVGLSRKDFRIRFTFRKKRYYIETFKLGWWIVSALMVFLMSFVFHSWYIIIGLLTTI